LWTFPFLLWSKDAKQPADFEPLNEDRQMMKMSNMEHTNKNNISMTGMGLDHWQTERFNKQKERLCQSKRLHYRQKP
jgi:hypothetical protein